MDLKRGGVLEVRRKVVERYGIDEIRLNTLYRESGIIINEEIYTVGALSK